jgi:Na+/proline symporter
MLPLNEISKEQKSSTISEYLSFNLPKSKFLVFVSTLTVIIIILFYTSAQWVAAGMIFSAFFKSSIIIGIFISAILVIIYSSIGGLKSSVLTDLFQAIFVIILLFVIYWSVFITNDFSFSKLSQFEGHLNLTYYYPVFPLIGFILGWFFASIGFGLSQPQILIRYFAAKESKDFNKAKWVYIFFLQITWIGFTFFGVLLKALMPDIPENMQEQGLALFINSNFSPIIIGLLISGMFSTISSTADSFLISLTNSVKMDVLSQSNKFKNVNNKLLAIVIGAITVFIAIYLSNTSVLKIAMNSVSYLGACIAPVILIKTLKLKHTAYSLSFTIIISLLSSVFWQLLGFSKYVGTNFFETLNLAVIGILTGLIFNFLFMKILGDK